MNRQRRIVLVVPELVASPDGESVLRQRLPALSAFAEMGEVFKIPPLPKVETPEALFLGMNPDEAQMRQGPLTISALGADPPTGSTHFHLSVLSFVDGAVSELPLELQPAEAELISENARRLNTKVLTFVKGEGRDHGLVWEDRGDFVTYDPKEFDSQPVKAVLPEGDAEVILRRYIDDSINLFSEMEFNLRRVDEGLPPLNVLWPWGHGLRQAVPNLALRRGEPAIVESNSLRLAGLSRLAGYRHGDRSLIGSGIRTRFAALAARLLAGGTTIAVLNGAAELRHASMLEELSWFAAELDRALLAPLVESALQVSRAGSPPQGDMHLTLLCPSATVGLGVTLSSHASAFPFDERTLEERLAPTRSLWQSVATLLAASQ